MKATGIVRRMDELGRVVIPKEIRRTLRIREGDPLEIFTEQERLMLKKYSPVSKIEDFAKNVAESLFSFTGSGVIVCDTDEIVAIKGASVKDLTGKKISEALRKEMEQRRCLSIAAERSIPIAETVEMGDNEVIAPVISEGDVIGAVILCGENCLEFEDLAALSADFIARQF